MKKETWYKFVYSLFRPVVSLVYPIRVTGRNRLPEQGPLIICANHSDSVDPVLISFALGKETYVHHLAKQELRRVPILGWLMEKMGSIFVRRGQRDIDSYKSCLRALKSGERILMFPEGTRVHGEDDVNAKTGVIHMAARTGAVIQPVYLPRDKKAFRTVPVVFGEPYTVEVKDHESYDALAQELMDRIRELEGK